MKQIQVKKQAPVKRPAPAEIDRRSPSNNTEHKN